MVHPTSGGPPRLALPPVGTALSLAIAQTWDGQPVGEDERVRLTIAIGAEQLLLEVDAPFHGDPPPAAEVGSTEMLWEHEVVELMLLGDEARYLELELSPHGHYLVLQLCGARNVVRSGLELRYEASIDEATVERAARRWRGRAMIPLSWLPAGCARLNAFAIHGVGEARRYLAWRAPGGERPDFHRLEAFADLGQLDHS